MVTSFFIQIGTPPCKVKSKEEENIQGLNLDMALVIFCFPTPKIFLRRFMEWQVLAFIWS